MFHRVTLIGRVGRDPEMRYTPDGIPVATLTVATTETLSKSLPGGGERSCPQGWQESYNGRNWEVTTWWRVTCWRGLAETVNQYLSKGRTVFVEGRVSGEAADGKQEPRVWQANDGSYRAQFEMTADTVKFLGGRGEGAEPQDDKGPMDEEALPF